MALKGLLRGGLILTGVIAAPAAAQQTTLRVGNWLPNHHLIIAGIVKPWAEAIERESNGTLKFDIMGSSIGRPHDLCCPQRCRA